MKLPIINIKEKRISIEGLKEMIREYSQKDIDNDDYININTLFTLVDELELKETPIIKIFKKDN